jgi:hypothetical protein
MNVRMTPSGSSYRLTPLALRPGDQLSYYFTYLIGTVQTTTPTINYAVPLTFQPKAFLPRVDIGSSATDYLVHIATSTPPLWADVHYTINGGTMQNVRMASGGTHVTLNTNDSLVYSMTYAYGTLVFETAQYTYVPTAPSFGYSWVNEALPTDPGTGCDANGPPFNCSPYPFSLLYADGGYHSTATSFPLVPVEVTAISTTYFTGNLDMLFPAFTYSGPTPRTGTGLALIPAASGNTGSRPSTSADALLGKNVSATPALASNFVVGGAGMAVGFVDINGLWSNVVDVSQYFVGCESGQCIFQVPLGTLTAGSPVDTTQVRYVVYVTESGATVNPSVNISDISFDNIIGG